MADHLNAPVTQVRHGDCVAKVASPAFDLDALLKEGGEGRWIEDTVCSGLGGVDDVLQSSSVSIKACGEKLQAGWHDELAFLVTFWPFFGPPLRPLPPAVGCFYIANSHLSECSHLPTYCTMPNEPVKPLAGSKAGYVLVQQPSWRLYREWLFVFKKKKRTQRCGCPTPFHRCTNKILAPSSLKKFSGCSALKLGTKIKIGQ